MVFRIYFFNSKNYKGNVFFNMNIKNIELKILLILLYIRLLYFSF